MVKKMTFLTLILLLLFTTPTYAESNVIGVDNYFDDLKLKQTKVYIHDEEFMVSSKWIPVRKVFEPLAAEIKWDHDSKAATISRNGTSTILHFAKEERPPQAQQIVMPREYIKLDKGTSYIDAAWLCYMFDPYNKEESKEKLKQQYQFLGIKAIESKPSVKDLTLHMFVEPHQQE